VANPSIHKSVAGYYSGKLQEHGPTPQGVDWNSAESQEVRFRQVLGVCDPSAPFSLIDYGCGFGALVGFLRVHGIDCTYQGFDIAADMVAAARAEYAENSSVSFASDAATLSPADYVVASGIFSVKLDADAAAWKEYMLQTLHAMNDICTRGFAFNALTSYSDTDKMRPDLYYADPCEVFDYCKRNFSKQVALLHDYGLYEFTIHVRKEK
jgi:SAM-dependent methyltransferase